VGSNSIWEILLFKFQFKTSIIYWFDYQMYFKNSFIEILWNLKYTSIVLSLTNLFCRKLQSSNPHSYTISCLEFKNLQLSSALRQSYLIFSPNISTINLTIFGKTSTENELNNCLFISARVEQLHFAYMALYCFFPYILLRIERKSETAALVLCAQLIMNDT
jgi:hypothetical protein